MADSNIDRIIKEKADKYRLDPSLIKAVIAVESNFNIYAFRREPHIEDTSWGLMQVLMTTARETMNNPNLTTDQLLNPAVNIEVGTKYLRSRYDKYGKNIKHALAAYNAGSVKYSVKTGGYINQSYVDKAYKKYLLYKSTEPKYIAPAFAALFLIAAIGISRSI